MTWQTNGINGSKFETLESRMLLTGAFPSAAENAIVYDAKGNLDVAYYDSSAHNLKYVQQAANGTWSAPTVIDGSSKDVGKYVTIAVGTGGFPAVAYQDSFNGTLKFAQNNGSSWTVITADKRKTTGFNPSMVFDAAGEALVTYYKQNTGDLDLATIKGKKVTLTTLQSAGNVGQFSSIAINPTTGKPAVAYSNGTGAVQYIAKSGTTFAKPVTVGKGTGGSSDVSLAFTGSSAAVGYVDPGTGKVDLGQLSGKTFSTTTVGTVTVGTTTAPQVLVDPTTHMPAVVYHDSTGVYVATTSTTPGGGFQTSQIQNGGSDTVAVVQPGSGSIVFSTVNNTGGTLTIDTTTTPPAAPSMVTAAATSPTAVSVTWVDNSTNEAGFLVERSTDNITFTTVATTQPNVTSFTDTLLTEATLYYYRVSAIGAAGNNSAGTTGAGGTQLVPAAGIATTTTFPAAPSAVAATPGSPTTINVSWSNNSHNPGGFTINRSTDGGTTWTPAGSVGGNVTTFSDSGLTEGTAYTYQVVAFNGSGGSTSPNAGTDTLPAAPSGLTTSVTSTSALTLTWQNNSAAATGFIVQRSTDATNFTTIGTTNGTTTSYSDTGLSEASSYYYQVITVGPGSFDSAASAPTNATTNPTAPSNLAATAASSNRINLTWTDNSTGATNVIVQRSSNGGMFATIATLNGSANSYPDINRTEGVSYSYRIQSIIGASASGFSATVTTVTLPGAPAALTATAGATDSGPNVTLSWTDNSISETGFIVQRSTDNGQTWKSLPAAPANSSATGTYVDNTASEGTTYSYQVAAVNAAGPSAFSNAPSVTIIPAAPSGLTAIAASGTEIDLAWTNNSLGETGTFIERSTDNATWVPVSPNPVAGSTYPDTGLTPGVTYNYRISAINAGGASGYATAIGITAPATPTNITATPMSNTEIDITWTPVSGATLYLVQRSLDGIVTSLPPVTTSTFDDLNRTEGTSYEYTVTAINAGGSSVAGGPVSITTTPTAPSGVTASGITATTVLVTWTNNSIGAEGFIVQRSSDGTNWMQVGPQVTQTSITDSTAQEATPYTYRIEAVNSGGTSGFVTGNSIQTVPLAPTNVVATVTSSTSVHLAWTDNSQGATGYTVQRSIDNENFMTIGSGDGTLQAFDDTHATAASQYWYRVYATNSNNAPSDYSNSAQITTTPAVPQNVVATTISATAVGITWNAVAGATGYNVLRSTDNISFAGLLPSNTNSYTDSTAIEGTQYYYIIEAANGSGHSIDSTSATATTKPSAPTSLTVTATTAGSVTLSWTNTSQAATNFKIERSDDNGDSFPQINTAAGTATSFIDSTVSEGSHYIYRIRATGAGGDSAYSNAIGADTLPAAPSGLTVSANSSTSVTVSWTDVSTHATNYVVSRSDDGGTTFNVVKTLGGNLKTYTDTVVEGGSYQYMVRATQTLVDGVTMLLSNWTPTQSVSTPPAAPSNVHATAISASEVDVTWTNNSAHQTGFKVYSSTDGVVYNFLGSALSTDTSYMDFTATAGTQYYYRVRATEAGVDSAPADSSPLTSVPAVPTPVSTSTASNPSVVFTWSDVAGETGFDVQHSTDGGQTWLPLGSTLQGVTTITDSTSVEDGMYQYRVRATNASGASAYSSALSASTFLGAPSGLTTTSVTGTHVSLSWTDHSSAAMGYEVQRSSDNGMTWTGLTPTLDAGATTYTDSTVADGTTYSYRVRGLNTAGDSDFTSTVNATTTVLAPTHLITTAISTTQVNLSWTNPSSTATSFQIWHSTDGGTTFTQFDSVSGQTTYSDHSLTAGQSVMYEVFAGNVTGVSPPSSPVSGSALPSAPTNLDVEPLSTTSLSLTWHNSPGATGYAIYRDSGDGFMYVTTTSNTTYTDGGLTEGSTYVYKVFAVNAGGSSSASNVSENETNCAAPTNLTAGATTATAISLSWTNNTQGASGYAVLISTGGTFDIHDATLDPTATSYVVAGLTEATTYEFQVYAYNGVGPSDVSNTVTHETAPLAPTLGTVSALADGNHITWTDNSAHSTGFLVQRSSDGGATYPRSFSVTGQTSYVDSSGNPNTSYTYRVLATDAGGNSAPSTTGTALTAPAAPTNLTATSTTSSSAHLTWTPDSHGAGAYTIQRSTDGTTFMPNGTALGSASSYTDNTAVAGTSYKYLIIATNTTGSSAADVSNFVTVQTAAPTGVATTSVSATSVSLTWDDVQGESGFTVQRSDDDSNWTTFDPTESGVTTYTDNTATEGKTFYYHVAGTNSSGTGDYSDGLPVLTLPAAASGVIATPISTTEVDLTWTDNAQAADGYDVYRSANAATPVLVVHGLAGDATSYPDSGASAGTNYTYQIFAYNATGSSTAATATALTIPGQPQNLTAVAPSDSEIDLTWSSVAGATSYAVERSPNGIDTWTTLGSVPMGAYQDMGLSEGTRYYYSVTATNATGAGEAATIDAPTLPAPITSLHATSPSATEVDLTWTDASVGATGYNLYRSTDSGHTFTTLTSLSDPAANSYNDTTTEGTSYVYRITPIDGSGEGDATDISITTQPASPTLTSATPVSASEVDLTWTNNSAHVTTFSVQRTPFGANTWSTLTSTLSSSTTTYPDQSAAAGTNYQYRVLANLTGANSGASNAVAALTNPAAVTTLGTQSISTQEIDLSWTLVNGATSYNILRSTDNVTFTQIDSVGSGSMTYQDTDLGANLTEGTRYYYQVVAHNSTGDSATGNTSYTSTLATPPSGLTLSVVSNNEIDLTWTNNSTHGPSVGVERSATGNAPWSQLTTINSPGASYQDTGVLGASTYYYRISAIDEGGTNYMTDVASVSALTAPNAPTITATAITDGTVSLSWTAPATATTYTVEDSTDGMSWNPVATGTSSTTAIDSGLTGNTTYQYRVRASNSGGTSPNSSTGSALTVPDAPFSLTGSAVSATAINLTWSGDVASNVTYSVYRSPGTGPVHYVKIGTATDAVAYGDTGLTPGSSYLYEVVAANASGSNVTPALSATIYTTPVAPASLARTIVSDTEVDLTWTASSGATSYDVSRSTDGVMYSSLMTLGAGASSYNDAAASGGTSYTYKVTAINSGGSQSSTIAALTLPTAPTGLTRMVVDNHDINVTWNASTGATSYTLQRSSDGESTWTAVTSSGTSTADVVAGGGTYTYRVRATDATGDSAWATSSSITVVPDAPAGVGATASDTAVHVTWSLSGGATHYRVQRSDDNGMTWSDESMLLGSSVTSFDDTGLPELTPYKYQVIASNGAGNSADSSSVSVVTKPTAPSSLATTSITSIEVDLSWTDNSNGLAAFDVERSDDAGTTWHVLGSTATGATTYNDSPVSPGSSYLYRVSADNGSVVSVTTAPLSVLTLAAAPTNIVATAHSSTDVTLAWDAMTGATSYTLTYSTDGGDNYSALDSGVVTHSYDFSTATPATSYLFQIVAVNATGSSSAGTSNAVTTVPATPTSFTTTGISASEIDLAWTDVARATHYEVDRLEVDGVTWDTLSASINPGDQAYPDTGLTAGTTYTYRVEALDAGGSSVPASSQSAVTTPATPTNIVATTHSATDITLAWDAMPGAATYTLTYSTDGGSNYSALADSVGTNSYDFSTATAATPYLFQIVAVNTTGSSSAGTSNAVTTVPATPTAFTATGVSTTEVDLGWTDVARATHYEVDRLEDDGLTWDTLTTSVNPGDEAYADTGLTGGTTYTYRVEALDAGGASAPTVSQSALTAPPVPTNVVATANSDTDVTLTWDAATSATSYTLVYSTDGGSNYTMLDSGVTDTTYDFSVATPATPYLFGIVAVNTTGSSLGGLSNTITTVPETPTDFTAHGVSTTEVDLAWTDVVRATHYEVDRLEDDGLTWDTLTTSVNPGDQAYADTGLGGGTTYTYRVEALDAGGTSVPTHTASALTAPASPTHVVATPVNAQRVDLTWDAMTGAASYTITVSTDNGMNYGPLATNVHATTYMDLAATPGTSHLFKVVAVNVTGSSAAGTSNAALTVPAAQTDFTATPVSANEVDLTWTDVTGATSYTIERDNGDGNLMILTTSLSSTDTSYHDTTANSGTTYTYEIFGKDTIGSSTATQGTALTVPASVSGITATTNGTTEIDLAWTADSGTVTAYQVFESTGGGTFSQVGSNLAADATSYHVTGLTAATAYAFEVLALNDSGASSTTGAFDGRYFGGTQTRPDLINGAPTFEQADSTINIGSDVFEGTPGMSSVPGAPNGFGTSNFVVEWDGNVQPLYSEQYTFYASSDDGVRVLVNGQVIGADHFNTNRGQTTDSDVVPYSFVAGNTYRVQVQFRQGGGGWDARLEWSSDSQTREFVHASDAVSATTVPTTPTGFTATGISASEVDLAWTDVSRATAYEVDRLEPDGVTWETLTTSVAPGAQAYVDHNVDGGTSYTYRVEALDAGGASAPTATQDALTAPSAPANIIATPISATEVDLTWDATTGADTYSVSVSIDGGMNYSPLASGLTDLSYNDTAATPGTSNLYRIVATNVTADSDPGTSNGALTVPAAQTDFAATPFNATQVNLTWTDVTGADSYTIERKTGSEDYQIVPSSLTGTDTSFHDTTAAAATAYTYEIFATDATGDSVATTHDALTVPAAVSITSTTIVGTGEVDLTWAADSGVVTGYRVLRSDDNGMNFSQVGMDLSSSTLALNDTGLPEASSHIYRVLALNDSGHSGNSDSMVETTLPATPANFGINAVSSSEIDLTFDAVARATGYEVDRLDVDGHTWDALTPDGGVGTNSYNDTGLTPGTNYTYRIEALDASGPSVSTDPATTITRPDVVANFTATVVSGNEVDLSWDAAGSATGYRVMREALDSGTFSQLTTTTLTSLSDTGLTEASDYFYKIIAYNSSGDGAATSEQDVTTDLNTPELAVTGQTNTSITLQWTNHSLVDTGYLIEQQTGPSTWSDVHDGAALTDDTDTDSVTITGLTEATAYNFRVTALGDNGLVSVATPVSGNTAPNDPTAITAIPSATPNVVLHWSNNSAHASSQLVERSIDGGMNWSTVETISGTATSYTDTTGVEATAYEYRVSAFKGTSQSGYATSTSVTTLPLAPTELTSTAVAYNEIDLHWTDNSAGATAYRIYTSSDGITYSQLGSDLPFTAHSYPDGAAAENATTYYKIVAVDDGGESAGTALTNATTPLAAPTSVVAATTTDTSTGDKTINLSWTNVSGVADNVKVERSSDGETWTQLVTLASDATSYSDDSAAENTTYTYRVYAVAGEVSSTHTASNDIKTLLSRPTGLTLSSPTPGSVVLTWNDVSSAATSYHVERSTDNVTFTDIHTINSASATTYTDSGRTEGTLYYYQVRAVSGSNTSNYSDVSSITTIPATPTTLTATPFSTTEIDLTWTDVSSTNTSYTVETSIDGGTTWTTAASGLGANAHTYNDMGLVEATDHEYRVFAIGDGGPSLDSNTSATNTIPAAASALTLASETATSVSLTWTDNSNGETNYEVWRATDGVHFTALTTSLDPDTTSYTDNTAVEGTSYQYEVRDNRNSVESAFTSQLDVTTLPAAPTGLNVASFTSSKVTLGWTDNSSGETGYKIARSTDGGTSWSVIATVGANSVSFSDNAVTEGLSYSYYVYAYNSAGNSTNSGTVTANIPPAAPSGMTITSFTPTTISLSWTNNSSHQTGFFVERSINGGGFSQIADVTSGTTYTDTGLTEAVTYGYRVRAHGATGNSNYGNSVSQKTPLIAPTGLTAITISTTEIDLAWSDNSGNESTYAVERSTDGGMTWSVLSSTLPANTTSYHNTGLTEGSTYTYRVRALRSGANSAYTSNVPGTTLPAAPSGISATATSESTVTVTWTDNSIGATGFTIERSLDGSTWGPAGTVGAGVTTFHDTGLIELTGYFYRVKATDAGGSSTFATTGSSVSTLPAAPSGLAVSAPTSDSVLLTWTDNSSGATGYKVERNDGNGWVQISAALASNTTSYTDLTVVEATLYSYRVRAVAGSVNSAYSNTQSITTVPADPDGIVATTVSTSEIDITWNNNSAGATAYLIEQSLDGGNSWTQIDTLAGDATSYQSVGLVEGTDYQYRVRAQDAGGFSLYTDSADASTLPATPSNFAASPAAGHIDLTWTDNSSGEFSYTVKRDNGGTWTTIASLGPDSNSFSDDSSTGGLISGQTYQYRVFCTGAGGDSAFAATSGTAV